jgi:hypothetical protein
MLQILAVVFGIGIVKSVSNVATDGSSILKINAFLLMIIVNNGIKQVPVHLALQDMCFKDVTVFKETHFVKQVTRMELVSLVMVATF